MPSFNLKKATWKGSGSNKGNFDFFDVVGFEIDFEWSRLDRLGGL